MNRTKTAGGREKSNFAFYHGPLRELSNDSDFFNLIFSLSILSTTTKGSPMIVYLDPMGLP